MIKAGSLSELAKQIDLPAGELEQTVRNYNIMAEKGVDTDFNKGENAYDRYYGDPSVQPNPNMHTIAKPPFYAVHIYPGDLGTKGGLMTNEKAEVLRTDGSIIEGLYATGNTASSVMGDTYPGAGATIGASMIFGYITANVVAVKAGASNT